MSQVYRPTRLTTKEFIKRAKAIHGNFYNYNDVKYIDCKTKVKIKCPIHGIFYQDSNKHILKKCGCRKCEWDRRRRPVSEFLSKAHEKYGDKFDYSKVNYISVNHKVLIICPIHGEFMISPRNHIRSKKGCSKCGREGIQHNSWTYSDWEKCGRKSKNFDSFKVYILKCFNENETFYKIGKTYTTVVLRYKKRSHMPYIYEIIKEYIGSARQISELENFIHNTHKEFRYVPKIKFEGMTECYNIFDENLIV